MGFPRQEYWNGLPLLSPGYLPDPGIEPVSPTAPALVADSLPLAPPGKPQWLLSRLLFVSVQLLSSVQHFVTPWTEARQASLFHINAWSLFKLISIETVMPCNHLILRYPLLL